MEAVVRLSVLDGNQLTFNHSSALSVGPGCMELIKLDLCKVDRA